MAATREEQWMGRALDLARRGWGRTSPNPMVGAVIVKDGVIVGEGWHKGAGLAHAEREAIEEAGPRSRGATLFVTLEPCCHFGRTPPCSGAVIDAGIAEVHYAVGDPNPRVAGGGHRQLEAAGIRVSRGPLEREARLLNLAFFHFITSGRPYVTAKYAMSLDGKIATRTGASQWITGEEARCFGHILRDASDAVAVGAGTVLADNPRLTTRIEGRDCRQPLRVVLDSSGRIPTTAALFHRDLPGRTLVATTAAMKASKRRQLEGAGVEVLVLQANDRGQVSLPALLDALGERQVMTLMVEGGAQLLGSCFGLGAIDEVWAFIGAKMLGGQDAPGPVGGLGAATIEAAAPFEIYQTLPLGPDLLIKARASRPDGQT